jgi:hypothetical protein
VLQRERKSPLALIVPVIDEPALRAYSWFRESDVLVRPASATVIG